MALAGQREVAEAVRLCSNGTEERRGEELREGVVACEAEKARGRPDLVGRR